MAGDVGRSGSWLGVEAQCEGGRSRGTSCCFHTWRLLVSSMRCGWLVLLALCLVCVQGQQPPSSSVLSSTATTASQSNAASSDSSSSNAITKTAANAKEGALAGTAIAPGPNHLGKTGPDDQHFVDAVDAVRPDWLATVLFVFVAIYYHVAGGP